MIVLTLDLKAMSGDRSFTKTDTKAKKKKAQQKRKNQPAKKGGLSLLSGDSSVVTDSTPINKTLFPVKATLRNITIFVGSLSQAEVDIVVRKESIAIKEDVALPVKEGGNKAGTAIDIPADCIVSVFLRGDGDFRAEEVFFSAIVSN